jgi:hypothetical protein
MNRKELIELAKIHFDWETLFQKTNFRIIEISHEKGFTVWCRETENGKVIFIVTNEDEPAYLDPNIPSEITKWEKLDFIQNPYITFLGCMTPELTANSIQEGIITTGFSRRCIFVYANRSSKCVPRRTTTTDQLNARDWLIQWGTKLSMVQGPFVWEDEAVE